MQNISSLDISLDKIEVSIDMDIFRVYSDEKIVRDTEVLGSLL